MDTTVKLPFQALLDRIKTLTPVQKEQLKQELEASGSKQTSSEDFMEFLLNGPVYSPKEISKIENNHKSITAWRTKE